MMTLIVSVVKLKIFAETVQLRAPYSEKLSVPATNFTKNYSNYIKKIKYVVVFFRNVHIFQTIK